MNEAAGRMKTLLILFVAIVISPVFAEPALPVPSARHSYLVVMDSAACDDAGWREAADILRRKHEADLVVVPTNQVEAALAALQRLHPRYVCFVYPPERIGREVVARIHRLMRRVDDDPYTDALWGILTGYEAADAQRIARRAEPLVVSGGFSSMGPGLAASLGAGFASSETDAHAFWTIDKDGNAQKQDVRPDPAAALADAFSTIPVELMETSGHATEKDWQIGYTVRAGELRCENGKLYTRSTTGVRHYFESPHPKLYLPMGNCLIGHVPGRDCMATAWIHSGGVHQMFGYTAVTFFGFMGWGVNTYFGNGSMNLAQSFHANGHALIHQLQTRFPEQADIAFDSHRQQDVQRQAALHQVRDRDLLGLLWDRDAVAFYGDPAWDARRRATPRGWTVEFGRGSQQPTTNNQHPTSKGNAYALTITTTGDGKWPNRPLVIPFAERLADIHDVTGPGGMDVVVTDDFILLPLTGAYASNTEVIVTFRAMPAEQPETSSESAVIRLDPLPEATAAMPADVSDAIRRAGENGAELMDALNRVPDAQRDTMEFLLANMAEPDLRTLSADMLVDHVGLAFEAWKQAPWASQVSSDLFRDAILPYASVDETREDWMPAMRKRCLPLIAGCRDPGEAALALNQKLFKEVNVTYHGTKRPKPNQSPSESIAAGYASCTGLSILLVDACRSVGIPARLVGVPQWSHTRGNHTWVEVWADGAWQPVGAAESHRLGDVWFRDAAAKADPGHVLTRIYATQYRRSATRFPLAWNPGYTYVSAVDVTAAYKPSGE